MTVFLKEKAAAVITKRMVENALSELQDDRAGATSLYRFYSDLKGSDRPFDDAFRRDLVAWQYGFDDFTDLSNLLDHKALAWEQLEVLLVFAAFAGHTENVESILQARPDQRTSSTVAALLLASPAVMKQLASTNLDDELGTLQLAPLVYLLNSRYKVHDIELRERRLRMTRELLELGADPNSGMQETDSIRGFRSLLGSAIECQQNAELAELLLANGADINDGPTLYEGSAMWSAVKIQSASCLDILLAAEPPLWHLCHALTHAIDFQNIDMVEQLLKAGADPNWNQTIRGFKGSAMHEALVVGGPLQMFELLLEHHAGVETKDRAGRTPLAVAHAMGRQDVIELLNSHGADMAAVRAVDKWLGQLVQGESASSSIPHPSQDELELEDHLWVHENIERGELEVAKDLISQGLDPFAVSYGGDTALHVAVARGEPGLVKAILARGGDVTIADFDGQTPLALCYRSSSSFDRQIEALLLDTYDTKPLSTGVCERQLTLLAQFERAADALCNGEQALLEQLLVEYPDLSNTRSVRPHRCTLINYIGVNGFEGERQKTANNAVELIHLLLAHGCDPSSVCFTYRGGPGENTIGLLTSSGVPPVSLQLPMVHALVQGGAYAEPGTRFCVDLYDAFLKNEVAAFLASNSQNSELVAQAFVLAISIQHRGLVEALLDADVDVNKPINDNVTAIHQAAFVGDRELVDLLLARGANPTLRDLRFDGTAAGWAYANEHEALGQHLEQVIQDWEGT